MQPEHDPIAPLPATDAPPLGTVYTDDRIAQPHVDSLLRAAGIEPQYPLPSQDVHRLMAEMGFACDASFLAAWCTDPRFRLLAPPRGEDGAALWFPRHVYSLIGRLEADRRWQPLHPLHVAKMSPVAVLAAQAVQDGYQPEDAVHDLGQYSLRDLLLMLARTTDPAVRQCLADMTLLKADALGFDTDAR